MRSAGLNTGGGITIAILGATGHIAKGLILRLSGQGYDLRLFARSPERVHDFMVDEGVESRPVVGAFTDFPGGAYDVVINCVGIGSPARLEAGMRDIFRITETFDDLVLDYLQRHPQSLYINLSSGAVYGGAFAQPVGATSSACFSVNPLLVTECYGIAKLNAEAKHRVLSHCKIIDLRVFGYFSRFIDPGERFLLSEIISCIREGKELITGPDNIVRDYVHGDDLASLIISCIASPDMNCAFDVCSRSPVTKFELLDYFCGRHGLKFFVDGAYDPLAVTGAKAYYYSCNNAASAIGYVPRYTSLETVMLESDVMLSGGRGRRPRHRRPGTGEPL